MVWRMTFLGRNITGYGVYALEKLGFVPKGTYDVQETLKVAADALVAGGKAKLFTPMREFPLITICSSRPLLNFILCDYPFYQNSSSAERPTTKPTVTKSFSLLVLAFHLQH